MGQSLTSRSTAEIIFETATLGAVESFAFVGNLLVIIASLRNRNLRTTTNLYIMGLALSDLLAACITMPMTLVTVLTGDWKFGTAGTYIQGFFVHFLIYVSMHTMALTAINRYFRIVQPHLYKRFFTLRKSRVFIVAVWVVALCFVSSFPVFGLATFKFSPGYTLCLLSFTNQAGDVGFMTTVLFFYVSVSLAVVCLSYYKVSHSIKQHQFNMASSLRSNRSRISVEEIKITKTLFFLVFGFIFCWIPTYVIATIIRLSSSVPMPRAAALLTSYLVYFSSALNPILYASTNRSFKNEFRQILLCKAAFRVSQFETFKKRTVNNVHIVET